MITTSCFYIGLGGKPRLLDIGGVPYLVPLAQKNKLYEMKDIPKMTQFSENDDLKRDHSKGAGKVGQEDGSKAVT